MDDIKSLKERSTKGLRESKRGVTKCFVMNGLNQSHILHIRKLLRLLKHIILSEV